MPIFTELTEIFFLCVAFPEENRYNFEQGRVIENP